MIDNELFGPKDRSEKEEFALEALVFSVQLALHRAMTRKGVSNKDVAELIGMSPARVSQIFSQSGPNLTLKTIAKIQAALGEDFVLVPRSEVKSPKKKPSAPSAEDRTVLSFGKPATGYPQWKEVEHLKLRKEFKVKEAA